MKDFPKIKGYKILKVLGKGGMSRVYLAIEEKLEREVAIKVLLSHYIEDERIRKRFLKEAKTAASLRHSNIVAIYDRGETEEGNFYFIMEYLSGGSLKEKIVSSFISPAYALYITREIANALAYAHKKGFIHRDIKPANIMFREDGVPVLADFGIAKQIGTTTKLTQTGTSIGTPYYMSPEQINGEKITGKTDSYALGAVLYEMLTGNVPYDAETTIAIIMKHLKEPIPRLRNVRGVKEGSQKMKLLQNLIVKMMAKRSENRFSAKEIVGYIDEIKSLFVEAKNIEKTVVETINLPSEKDKTKYEETRTDAFESKNTIISKEVDKTVLEEEIPKEFNFQDKKRKGFPYTLAVGAILFVIVFSVIFYFFTHSKKGGKENIENYQVTNYNQLNKENENNGIVKKIIINKKNKQEKGKKAEGKIKKDKLKKSSGKNETENTKKSINIKNSLPKSKSRKTNIKIIKGEKSSLNFNKEMKKINILFRRGRYLYLTEKLFSLLRAHPEMRKEIRDKFKTFLRDKNYQTFIHNNKKIENKVLKLFPKLKILKSEKHKKEFSKENFKLQIEKKSLTKEYSYLVPINNLLFFYRKKVFVNIETGKKYKVDSKPNMPPVLCNNNLFFTTEYGRLYRINGNGLIKKIFTAKWDINYPPVIKNNKIYVVSLDKNIYCFNCNGKKLWKFKSDWEIESNVGVDNNGNIYYITKGSILKKISSDLKKLIEKPIKIKKPQEIILGKDIFIRTKRDNLFIYSEELKLLKRINFVKKIKLLKNTVAIVRQNDVLFYYNYNSFKSYKCQSCKNVFLLNNFVIAGGKNKVLIYDINTGSIVKEHTFDEAAKAISLYGKNLYVLGKKAVYIIKFNRVNYKE